MGVPDFNLALNSEELVEEESVWNTERLLSKK